MENKINYPLIFGSIVVVLLLMMSFFPKVFTSNDPIYEEPVKYIEVKVDGEVTKELGRNPIRPNKENLMGTDDAGRDVYARIVFGTKNTMKLVFLIAIFRMLLAFPIGILAGIKIKPFSSLIKFLNTFFSSIPILIISFFIFNFNYFDRLQIDKSIIIFAVVLSFLGFAKLASMIEDQTKIVMNEDFIEGEIAIGKTKSQIVLQNIVPHLIPTSISLFFKEIASALFLIAQLAVLSTFVGTSRESKSMSFRANYLMGFEPEWGGMLTKITRDVQNLDRVWWPTVFPILIFTVSILGLNLLGEGLREEFEKRDSRVITIIRRVVRTLSPRVLYLEIKEFKKYKKPVLIKLSAVLLVVIYVVIPKYKSLYDFNTENVFSYAKTLTKDEFDGRLTGTEGHHKSGEYIISELESFGFKAESHYLNTKEIDKDDILSLDS
ncbi:MAG: ABC transporter permease subunit, partial [Clostridium sp.]|nr:ABC transporter permease subunit [Clostridium sp.]